MIFAAVALTGTLGLWAQVEPPAPGPATSEQNMTKADPASFPEVVASVNGHDILKGELLSRIEAVRERVGLPGGALPVQIYRTVLDDMINLELLYQFSESSEFAATPEEVEKEFADLRAQFPTEEAFQGQLASESMSADQLKAVLKKDLSVQKLVENKLAARVVVSDADMRRFYDENQDQMREPEQLKLRHILIRVEKDATPESKEQARAKIASLREQVVNGGADFAELAKANSEDPSSRDQGGEMVVRRGQTVEPFEKAAFQLKPEEVSSVVETQYGFHIIQLAEAVPARIVPFDDVAGRIEDYLRQQGVRQEVESELEGLRTKASIALYI
jgi:peptidyl-prolyl cis-trans isomerase C